MPNRTLIQQLQTNRRWLVALLSALTLIFALILAGNVVQVLTTLGNRHAGVGNRTVSCATLHEVAPQTERQLAECAGYRPR